MTFALPQPDVAFQFAGDVGGLNHDHPNQLMEPPQILDWRSTPAKQRPVTRLRSRKDA